jgi:hypothetical protein
VLLSRPRGWPCVRHAHCCLHDLTQAASSMSLSSLEESNSHELFVLGSGSPIASCASRLRSNPNLACWAAALRYRAAREPHGRAARGSPTAYDTLARSLVLSPPLPFPPTQARAVAPQL